MEKALHRTKRLIQKSQHVLILLHEFPDGDTIASSLALYLHLQSKGKRADLVVKGGIPSYFRFLTAPYNIKNDFLLGDYDLIFAIDCGDSKRTGFPMRVENIASSKAIVNIDHHSTNSLKKYAKINLVDEKAAAAAEIVYNLIRYLGGKIDSRIATYILAAIYYDTGGFQHSNVTSDTLKIASDCLSHGARIGLISDNVANARSSSGLKLWGQALKNMKIKNNIAVSYLSSDDIASSGAQNEDSAGVVNLMNTIPLVRLAILFIDSPDGKIRASLRTEENDVDLSQLARLFGGGGHKKAAGFTLEKSEFLGIVDR